MCHHHSCHSWDCSDHIYFGLFLLKVNSFTSPLEPSVKVNYMAASVRLDVIIAALNQSGCD